MPVPDLFRDGLARGWKTHNGAALDSDLTLEADVAIIGSGAGGGTTAEILSAAGYKVLLIEEGHRSQRPEQLRHAQGHVLYRQC